MGPPFKSKYLVLDDYLANFQPYWDCVTNAHKNKEHYKMSTTDSTLYLTHTTAQCILGKLHEH